LGESKSAGVARHVRAWIETPIVPLPATVSEVARHVRAWIETSNRMMLPSFTNVARHVRAWIETQQDNRRS